MKEKASKPYRRLDRAERAAIESGLDKRKSCRQWTCYTFLDSQMRDIGR